MKAARFFFSLSRTQITHVYLVRFDESFEKYLRIQCVSRSLALFVSRWWRIYFLSVLLLLLILQQKQLLILQLSSGFIYFLLFFLLLLPGSGMLAVKWQFQSENGMSSHGYNSQNNCCQSETGASVTEPSRMMAMPTRTSTATTDND